MIKLLQWLSVALPVFAVWLSIVLGYIKGKFIDKWMEFIIVSPIIFVLFFGITSAFIILYRVFTFRTCEGAYKELQDEIVEAKADLKDKGFEF